MPNIIQPKSNRPAPKPKPPAPPKPVGPWSKSPTERENLASASPVKMAPMFSGSQARQYSQFAPTQRNHGTGGGNQSHNAFAQAMANQQQHAATQGINQLQTEYGQRAQKVRSGDTYAQRADQVRRFGMTEGQRADLRNQSVQREQQLANYQNQISEARKNAQNNLLSNTLNMVAGGGILNSLATYNVLKDKAGSMGLLGGGGGFGPIGSGLLGGRRV